MFKVTFSFEDGSVVEHFANAGDNLLELAREANVAIDAPCSGNASCGKCRVQLKKENWTARKPYISVRKNIRRDGVLPAPARSVQM